MSLWAWTLLLLVLGIGLVDWCGLMVAKESDDEAWWGKQHASPDDEHSR